VDDGLHHANIAMLRQQGEARTDYGDTGELAVLLRPITAHAQPAPTCDDDRCDHTCHDLGSKSETKPWH
jgi:hypothetical protein